MINIYKAVSPYLALKGMMLPGLWIGGMLSAVACSFEGIAWRYTLSRLNEEACFVFLIFSGVYTLLKRICEGRNVLYGEKPKKSLTL